MNPPEFVESTPSVPDNLCYVIRSKLFEKPEQVAKVTKTGTCIWYG